MVARELALDFSEFARWGKYFVWIALGMGKMENQDKPRAYPGRVYPHALRRNLERRPQLLVPERHPLVIRPIRRKQ